ncbi:hypothetical protein [Actinopolymorpha pittospori]
MMNVLAGEWTKLHTVAATRWAPVAAFTAVPALAALVALTRSLQPDDTILGGALTGAVVGQLGAAILGVLMMSGEYRTGLIRTTFTATPRRLTVLGAKATVIVTLTYVGGLAAGTLGYATGRVLLAEEGYRPGEPVPALFGIALTFSATGLLGLTAAVILRHTAGALTLAIGVVLLPAILGPILGAWGRWVVAAAPTTALQKLAQSSDATAETMGGLGAWPTLALVCGYTIIALGIAGWLLRSRDA